MSFPISKSLILDSGLTDVVSITSGCSILMHSRSLLSIPYPSKLLVTRTMLWSSRYFTFSSELQDLYRIPSKSSSTWMLCFLYCCFFLLPVCYNLWECHIIGRLQFDEVTEMDIVSMKCPNCGALVYFEREQDRCFCSHCESQLQFNDTNNKKYTYTKINATRIKEAQTRESIW